MDSSGPTWMTPALLIKQATATPPGSARVQCSLICRAGLLEPWGFERIEPASTEGRIEARDDPREAGGEHGSEHHRRGEQGRPVAFRGHPLRHPDPQREPDHAAHAREQDGFGQELEEDVAAA